MCLLQPLAGASQLIEHGAKLNILHHFCQSFLAEAVKFCIKDFVFDTSTQLDYLLNISEMEAIHVISIALQALKYADILACLVREIALNYYNVPQIIHVSILQHIADYFS